jgi:hypothetical protein
MLTILNVEQGTEEWHTARRGIITASAIGKLITPSTLKPAQNDTARQTILNLVAERITGHTDPTYPTRDMERGTWDEPVARDLYSEHIAPVVECGFMVRDDWGHKIGFSPDGLVGDDGLIEVKSRRQKAQLATILTDQIPLENMAQCQTGLLVSGRSWIDYVSYCSGMPLWTKRILPDIKWFTAIVDAAAEFEKTATQIITDYTALIDGLPETVRVPELEEMRF